MTAFLPTGQGDITNPRSWRDAAGNIPPLNLGKVPVNATYPYNSDGRYWWTGNLDNAPAGVNYFIGDEAYLDTIAGSVSLEWQIVALSTDGSAIVLSSSIDGGTTWVDTTLPLGTQGLQSGAIVVAIPGTVTGLAIKVTYSGGAANASATLSEVAVSVTRNANSQPIWDSTNPLDPINYNGRVVDAPGYDNLGTLVTRMLIRLGFSNQTTTPPPGMAALLQEFLQSSQNFLYRRYSQLRTRRWFRWQMVPGQRFYSVLDSDENALDMLTLDVDKPIAAVFAQDSRNVWWPLVEGIDPSMYTMLSKPWRPARYTIRNAIEIYPAPDQTYWLWVMGHFGLQSFSQLTDQTTIDSELVFLHALANAKSHYGQPDANNIEAQANALRGELVAASHKTARYIPGSRPVPPAVRPTLVNFES
jgi:hypothetical protein